MKKFSVTEKEKRCIGCYLMHNGNILLLKKSFKGKKHDGHWGIIAGEMEVNELPIVALLRETMEEAGIRMNMYNLPMELFCDCKSPNHSKESVQVICEYKGTYKSNTNQAIEAFHVFLCTIIGNRPTITCSDEHEEFMWLPPEMALMLDPLIEDERINIKKILLENQAQNINDPRNG